MSSIGLQKFPSRGYCQRDKYQIFCSSWLQAQELSQSTTLSEKMIVMMFAQLGWRWIRGGPLPPLECNEVHFSEPVCLPWQHT